MVQQVKVLATEPSDLSSNPGTHMVEGKKRIPHCHVTP